MSRHKVGPGTWVDDGPATPRPAADRFAVAAVVMGAMRPILRGTVLSQNLAVDDAHTIADRRLRQKYSIIPGNRR